jgi:hypothetical protein
MATMCTLAWPCFPVLEVDMSTICKTTRAKSQHFDVDFDWDSSSRRKEAFIPLRLFFVPSQHASLPPTSAARKTHLARAALDDDVTSLSKTGTLCRVGERGTGVGGLKVQVVGNFRVRLKKRRKEIGPESISRSVPSLRNPCMFITYHDRRVCEGCQERRWR